MKTYTQNQLDAIIKSHGEWLTGGGGCACANLIGANLRGANLSGANLSYADLSGANLRGASLFDANLSGASLLGADLRDANLRDANLIGANLRGANLSGANLSYADLSCANLSGANLRDANLSGASLLGADLLGADLRGANLLCTGNMINIKTIQVDRWVVGYTHDTMQIGCQRHMIAEWFEFSDEEIASMDDEALDWWRVWKPILQSIIASSPAEPTGVEQ